MRARRLLARLHGWIGAAVALFLLLVSLTGALLAFDAEIFRAQYPYLASADPAAARAAPPRVDAMLAAARAGYDRPFEPMGLFMPNSRVEIDTAMLYGTSPAEAGTVMLVVDPATGAYRGRFLLEDAIGHTLIDLHHDLLMGELAGTFVALLGLLLAALALTGLYLWWPRHGALRRKLRPPALSGRPLGRWYRVHGWIGVWAALPIVLFGLTGTATARPDWFGGLLAKLPWEPPAELAPAFAGVCAGRVGPDQALRAAQGAVPGQRLASFNWPHGPGEPFRLTFKPARPLDVVEGDTVAFVHATCPGIVRTAAPAGARGVLGRLVFSLHSGRAFGPALGDLLVLAAGLASTLLAGSGLYVFVARHLTGRRRARASAWIAHPAE